MIVPAGRRCLFCFYIRAGACRSDWLREVHPLLRNGMEGALFSSGSIWCGKLLALVPRTRDVPAGSLERARVTTCSLRRGTSLTSRVPLFVRSTSVCFRAMGLSVTWGHASQRVFARLFCCIYFRGETAAISVVSTWRGNTCV